MGYRQIKGKILQFNGEPYSGFVRFVLTNSFTADVQYPRYESFIPIQDDGEIEATLWANESGAISSKYSCYLPDNESFEFTLADGAGILDISLLRTAGISEPPPNYNSLWSYIHSQLGNLSQATDTIVADINISANRVICSNSSGRAIYADNTIPSTSLNLLGVSKSATLANQSVPFVFKGRMIDSGWNYDTTKPLFLSTNGFITQTVPSIGYLLIVGKVISPTIIYIDFEDPILRN